MSTRDAVIVTAKRTPVGVGKPGKGILSGIHSVDLSTVPIRAILDESGIDPALIDDVIWGCVSQVGEQSCNIGRNAALASGLPESVPGTTIDRQCGSSQQAIHFAAAALVSGQADVVVAGGVEVMSRTPMFSNIEGGDGPFGPLMKARYPNLVPQGVSAEMIAAKWGLNRTELDSLAVESHARAAQAEDDGLFAREIVGVETRDGLATTDQGIRRGTNLAKLATLPTPFKEDGVVSAGNASQISDGSAALLMMTSERALSLGITPIARVHSTAVIGDDPILMLTAPIPATRGVLQRSGLDMEDIGVFEVNEAFASVVGAWLKETGANPDLVNPRGGAMSLGHPLGASGARIATTLLHHMQDNGIKYGLQTMCEGGGMANATIFELL
ncbi:thiolase family protein [Gulosibacter molinativorax]|uniref:Acetyl-CoA C-acyltransferase n=1 Tax=Gulosibacter molinativorax TaxID=256821 RepID=A0ABT7C9M1_9MICO|nr:thiolase family protein [Gulosibacter molinativorax]MDJ1371442.1 acetyl-CoA C-acyltransferase [Gulosibacter molinativorax]QUY62940.1 Acetyl-CoA C-acetyltransferase [Gulosibacter molinativorax]